MPTGFGSLALSPALLAVVRELGYVEMTPIQAKGIPVLLAGKDLVGQAKTGSGKTAAFALPILQDLSLHRHGPQALVLCPTRELCAQVAREFRKLGRKHAGLHVLVLSGGLPVRPQLRALARRVHVVVGTPGRVLDHLGRRSLDLARVTTAVLDEADRMLDMGFSDEMDRILGALPRSRQTAFFSATFPDSIEAMSRRHQRDAVRVTVDEPGEETPEIRQRVLAAEPGEKLSALYRVLAEHAHESALVFCHQKATVAELASTLAAAGVSAACLHGDLEQVDRDRVMAMFRNRSVRVLVATDVAARGIDVVDLDLVVNYDLPSRPDVYIHRIGRTGRAGKPGLAVSLATRRDEHKLTAIEERIRAPLEHMPAGKGRSVEELASLVARAPEMDTIHIAGGRKDKVRPADILGALTGEAGGLRGADIGRIEIHDRRSYVAVARRVSRKAVESLNNGRIKGRRFRASLLTAR
ncbi:MAG: ATP-dependent RNA helicase DbpA [Planctomycetota bacterium]|jgi:ATP-independent RNA helicase DbpA